MSFVLPNPDQSGITSSLIDHSAMKITRFAFLSFAAALSSLVASAQQVSSEAFVSSVMGSATVIVPGSTTAVPVVAGQKLPEGSTVATAAGGSVMIQSHEGIETGIGAKSSVTIGMHSVSADGVRTAVIDLKEGVTVSALDPSKRAVNNYAVRTPKGVAAARGTTYSTTVRLSSGGEAIVTVNTLTGTVSFSIVGGPTVSVAAGRSADSRSTTSTSISEAIAAATTPEAKQDIADALNAVVTVVAVLAQTSPSVGGGNSQNTLNTVVENVTKAANEVAVANPTLAQAIVTSTVTAVQVYAGKGSDSAMATINRIATGANQDAADAAVAADPTPIVVTVTVNPDTKKEEIVVPRNPTQTTQPMDITIRVVSPSR